MIARLTGRLAVKSPESLVIDVNGVGYEVFASMNTFYGLPDVGGTVALHVHTQMRENALELFGFGDATEKSVFGLLLNVSGVGPRMALAILSGMTAADLLDALDGGDVARLVSVPGVGKKRAERLIVELKDRVRELRARTSAPSTGARSGVEGEAVSALTNLGYRKADAERVVRKVVGDGPADLAEVIRLALRQLS